MPPPHPPIPQFGICAAIGKDAEPADPLTLAAAGTLNCLVTSMLPQVGQCGTSDSVRTSVSKMDSQGWQRYS